MRNNGAKSTKSDSQHRKLSSVDVTRHSYMARFWGVIDLWLVSCNRMRICSLEVDADGDIRLTIRRRGTILTHQRLKPSSIIMSSKRILFFAWVVKGVEFAGWQSDTWAAYISY